MIGRHRRNPVGVLSLFRAATFWPPREDASQSKAPHSLRQSRRGRRPLSAPLKREGGAFIVLINQAIVLDFVVDSGAGDVIIPQDVFSTLIRTGTIQELN